MVRSKRLLELGGAKVTELEALIAQAEQFAWGPADITADISGLHSRLRDAKQWVAQVIPSSRSPFLCASIGGTTQQLQGEQLQASRACSSAVLCL